MVAAKYATFWPRLLAALLDALLLTPAVIFDHWFWSAGFSSTARVAWFLTYGAAFPVYSVVFHGLYGWTLGKRLCGVRVVDVSERPISFRQSLLRDFPLIAFTVWSAAAGVQRIREKGGPYHFEGATALDLFTWTLCVWFALELVATLLSEKRRSMHDLFASTVVVRMASVA